MKGGLPRDVISAKQFPHVFAWIERFNKVVKDAKGKAPKPATLKGDAAAKRVLNANFAEPGLDVDTTDPIRFKKGDEVEIWPIDSGFTARDRGRLVGLSNEEFVLQIHPSTEEGKGIRLHFPRTGFRIRATETGAASKL